MFRKKLNLHHDSNEADLLTDIKEGREKDEDLLQPIDPNLAGFVSTMYYRTLSSDKIKAKLEKSKDLRTAKPLQLKSHEKWASQLGNHHWAEDKKNQEAQTYLLKSTIAYFQLPTIF